MSMIPTPPEQDEDLAYDLFRQRELDDSREPQTQPDLLILGATFLLAMALLEFFGRLS